MSDTILVPLDVSAASAAALTVVGMIPSRRVRLLAVESELDDLSANCLGARDCRAYLERLAEQALPVALTLAASMGLPIHLLRVVAFDPLRAAVEAGAAAAAAYGSRQAEMMSQARAYLDGRVQSLRNENAIASSELRTGSPADELLAALREGDLVVLTTRERGGLARWFLGSVGDELLRHAPGPVKLVRARTHDSPHRQPDEEATLPATATGSAIRSGGGP